MDCNEVRELLSPYNDNELSEDELREVADHLATCRDCAFESTQIADLKQLIRRWDGVPGSQEFRAGVVGRAKEAGGPSSAGWAQLILAVIAGLLLAAGIVFLMLHLQGEGISLGEWLGITGGEEAPPPAQPPEPEAGGPAPLSATPTPQPVEPPAIRLPKGVEKRLGPVTIRRLDGKVSLEEPGGVKRAASRSDVIPVGRSVMTSPGARVELGVDARYRASLGPESSLTVGTGSVRLRRGSVLLISEPPLGPGDEPRIIRSPDGTVLAAGAYELRVAKGEAKVYLAFRTEGTVRLVTLRGSVELLRAGKHLGRSGAGQEMKLDAAGRLTGPALYRGGAAVAPLEWKD